MARTYFGKVTCAKTGVTVKRVKKAPCVKKKRRRSRRKHGLTWL